MSPDELDFTNSKWIPRSCKFFFCENSREKATKHDVRNRLGLNMMAEYYRDQRSLYSWHFFYVDQQSKMVGFEYFVFGQPLFKALGRQENGKDIKETQKFIFAGGLWQALTENDVVQRTPVIGEDGFMAKVIVRVISRQAGQLTLKHHLAFASPYLLEGK